MTWRISSPSSSWAPSTPWPPLRWLWPAFTSWSSLRPECCTAWPTCVPCRPPRALWPTPLGRFRASPWPCRSSWRSQRTPERPAPEEAGRGLECQCNMRRVITPQLGFVRICQYFFCIVNCETWSCSRTVFEMKIVSVADFFWWNLLLNSLRPSEILPSAALYVHPCPPFFVCLHVTQITDHALPYPPWIQRFAARMSHLLC